MAIKLVVITLAHVQLLEPGGRPCAHAEQPSSVLGKGHLAPNTVEGKRSNLGTLPTLLLLAEYKVVSHEPPNTRKAVA